MTLKCHGKRTGFCTSAVQCVRFGVFAWHYSISRNQVQRFSTGGSQPRSRLRSCLDWVAALWDFKIYIFIEKVLGIYSAAHTIQFNNAFTSRINLGCDFTIRKKRGS